MHIVPAHPERFWLLDWNRDRYGPFDSLDEVYDCLVRSHISVDSVGEKLGDPYRMREPGDPDPVRYIILTDSGETVPATRWDDIRKARRAERMRRFIRRHYGYDTGLTSYFRNGPVPRTGRRGKYCRLRYPRSLNEKRAAAAAEADGELRLVRGKRHKNNLADAWDDFLRGGERNWKRQRRTQWKPKTGD